MATFKQQIPQDYLEVEDDGDDDDYSESEGFDSDCDSDMDPTYSIIEETQDQLSNPSMNKRSNAGIGKELNAGEKRDSEGVDVEEVDEKSFEQVKKVIEAGIVEKLKVEHCKVYLRKNGLRLTGNKQTLIQRMMEHQEILNGGGEKKYPVWSFVLNCKGDACIGDVVMFEQNVYEAYSIVSRSASGPPCGTRIVVGRIVKESYGAAKQQHTFTIEVLWSKGEKPLSPLHALLIKGRNLYRLKTLRQKWEDERERQSILMEKHARGSLARSARESRIQDKEMRKVLRENRGLKKERNRHKSQLNSTLKVDQRIPTQHLGSLFNREEATLGPQPPVTGMHDSCSYMDTKKQTVEAQRSDLGVHQSNNSGSWSVASDRHHPVSRYAGTTWENGFCGRYRHGQPLTCMNHFQQQQPCKYYAQGRCYYGQNCKFSHNLGGQC